MAKSKVTVFTFDAVRSANAKVISKVPLSGLTVTTSTGKVVPVTSDVAKSGQTAMNSVKKTK